MPFLSDYAKKEKVKYFFGDLPKDVKILEVGSGDGWLGNCLKKEGFSNYTGLDISAEADISGDILDWKRLGIEGAFFDAIVAFEVVEHVDCFREFFDILKPGGFLFLTSPLPHMDWMCRLLEIAGLNQKRTSPHNHLIYFKNVPFFEAVEIRTKGLMAQWGKFKKPKGQK